ncbi:MAG: ABC transporter substrate-binding protein, partial [Opitutaceae bacterium]|nr:ABC transporter substrate-binding protein [Opitutaceae bacterium]
KFLMNKPTLFFAAALLGTAFALSGCGDTSKAGSARNVIKVRMGFDEDTIVTRLADSLGYFQQEGVEIVPVDIMEFAKEDYLFLEPMNKGQVDAYYHWFNHTVFGARHGFPVQAVIMFNDSPSMKVLVANRVKDEIKSAADFRGRNVAEGAGYATKAVLTGYLARKAGLPPQSYTSLNHPKEGRLEAVLSDLRAGKVDVMNFQEPVTSGLLESNLTSELYDLNTREGTVRALGAPFPAQSILMAPQFIKDHPDTVQRLVNAYVRAMRYINTHTLDEIVANLPASYFANKDRQAEIKYIQNTLSSYARGDYSFSPDAVRLAVDAMLTASFDSSAEGIWRATGDASKVKDEQLYTNEFVTKAMREIK